MKYKITLNNRVYEVEVEAGKAMLLDEYEAVAPAVAAPVAAAPVAAPAAAIRQAAARRPIRQMGRLHPIFGKAACAPPVTPAATRLPVAIIGRSTQRYSNSVTPATSTTINSVYCGHNCAVMAIPCARVYRNISSFVRKNIGRCTRYNV